MNNYQIYYKKYFDAIHLTDESSEYQNIKEKDEKISQAIETELTNRGYKVIKTFQQGSMSTKTAVIPINGSDYDIDKAIIIDEKKSNDELVENDPTIIKKIIKDVLFSCHFKEPEIKTPCVTANYLGEPIHIDYVVYKQNACGQLYIGLGKESAQPENKKWKLADPETLKKWLTFKDNIYVTSEERAQFRRIVSYLKRWRDIHFTNESVRKKIYSIGLTAMVHKSISFEFDNDSRPNDHLCLQNTISNFNKFYTQNHNGDYEWNVRLPHASDQNIFEKLSIDAGNQLYNKLSTLHAELSKLSHVNSVNPDDFQKLFGTDFPDNISIDYAVESRAPGIFISTSGA